MARTTSTSGALVAIIDDDEAVRDGLSSLLRSLGFEVEVFPSAHAFLLSPIDRPACLILDIRMPGMNGLDLQHHLMAGGFRVPVIFITAHVDQEAENRALAAGAVAFLRKPFREEVLIAAIRTAIAGSGTPGPS